MPYTSANPRAFAALMTFLNLEVNGDPSTEDTALYTWFDELIKISYDEAEGYCGQPLRTGTVYYQFYASKAQRGLEANHSWKLIPYNAGTTLTTLQWRTNEFGTYANYDASNFACDMLPADDCAAACASAGAIPARISACSMSPDSSNPKCIEKHRDAIVDSESST